jgi:predicted nucleotidyltransferase
MGSQAYGVSNDTSDQDVYGVCIPPKELVFPHLGGEIPGFGRQIQRFEVWQEHHVRRPDNQVEYDFSVYGIVKFFQLCTDNNPNMLDSLCVPRNCVIHSTAISEFIRENRKMFFHKGSYQKFRGYSYAQMSKIRNKTNSSNPKRAEDIEKNGMDTKFAYHVVRLALECEQILATPELDIQRDREILKSIRRGEWTFDRLEQWFTDKEKTLEDLYVKSDLRSCPDEDAIKKLLLQAMEMHYGSLQAVIKQDVTVEMLLNDLSAVIQRYSST